MNSENNAPRRTNVQRAMRAIDKADRASDTEHTVDGAIEQRMSDAREENPTRMAPEVRAPTMPDALADKMATTLDMATATNLEKIDKMISRLQSIRNAFVDEMDMTKRRIYASITLADETERMAMDIEAQFRTLLERRKQTINQE